MTTNISPDVLRSKRPTRGQDAKRLVEAAKGPLRRRDCVCIGGRGYLPGVSSAWDDRDYRKRWQVASETGSGSVSFESVCAPTRQRDADTFELTMDLGAVYMENNVGVPFSDEEYAERKDGVVGGVIVDVTLSQWIDGTRETVGELKSEAVEVNYALPSRSGSSRLLYTQYHCVREGEDLSFAYQEGFSDFGQLDEEGLYPHITVSIDLDTELFDPDLPTDIAIDLQPYESTDSGLTDIPRFPDNEEPGDGIPYTVDGEGITKPVDTAFMVHVLGWSVWAVGGVT
jgi:hypothetical protein